MVQVIVINKSRLIGINRLQQVGCNLLRLEDELESTVNCRWTYLHLRHGQDVHHKQAARPPAHVFVRAGVDFEKGQVDLEGTLHKDH